MFIHTYIYFFSFLCSRFRVAPHPLTVVMVMVITHQTPAVKGWGPSNLQPAEMKLV